MGSDDRPKDAHVKTAPYLIRDLIENGHEWSYFAAIDFIEQNEDKEALGVAKRPREEKVRFRTDSSLGFPSSDIKSITYNPDAAQGQGKYEMMVRFLGLSGASSPLPSYYLESLAQAEGDSAVASLRPFFDFFSHRVVALLYRAWKKYRYDKNFLPGAHDAWSERMFSLVGLHDQLIDLEPNIQWSRLLAYTGLIASKRRSPMVLSGVIAHAFNLKSVNIIEYVFRKVDVPDHQKWQLGKNNGALGLNTILGSRVPDRCGKFIVQINDLSSKRFREFLPSGSLYNPLRHLVEFLITDQFAYDIELNIVREEVPPMQLSSKQKEAPARLGWTTFIGKDHHLMEGRVVIRGRG